MKRTSTARRQLMLAGLAAFELGAARAQDPAKVMPRAYRVVLDNDKVRVLEFTGRPGMGICGEGMHSHPAHLTIVMNGFQGAVTNADGTSGNRERNTGDVFWSEAETHKLENTGKTSARVLIVELKTAGRGKA